MNQAEISLTIFLKLK